jgi:hypothetical protein
MHSKLDEQGRGPLLIPSSMLYAPSGSSARPASGNLRLAARKCRTVLPGDLTLNPVLRNKAACPTLATGSPFPETYSPASRVTANDRCGHYSAKAGVATPVGPC